MKKFFCLFILYVDFFMLIFNSLDTYIAKFDL